MKKLLIFVLGAAMLLSLAACGKKEEKKSATEGSGSVQIANPFIECKDIAEAAETAGFEITAPEAIGDYTGERVIRAISGSMIELVYSEGDDEVRIRKALDSEDISGLYEVFDETETVKVGENDVEMRGAESMVKNAIWTSGDYSYSVSVNTPVEKDAMLAIVGAVA